MLGDLPKEMRLELMSPNFHSDLFYTFDSMLLSYHKICPQPLSPAAPPVSKKVWNGYLWGIGEL